MLFFVKYLIPNCLFLEYLNPKFELKKNEIEIKDAVFYLKSFYLKIKQHYLIYANRTGPLAAVCS